MTRWALAKELFFPKPSASTAGAVQAAESLIYLPERLLTCRGLSLVAKSEFVSQCKITPWPGAAVSFLHRQASSEVQ